jgi:hypothetical protein
MLESLTFFGVSMEYFWVFEELLVSLCSFHFGVAMEFSVCGILSLIPWFCRICKTVLPISDCKTMLPSKYSKIVDICRVTEISREPVEKSRSLLKLRREMHSLERESRQCLG